MSEFWTTDPAHEGGRSFEESRSLWPDPFEAPGVPPADVLLRLAENPSEDPDLVAQIQENTEARRALFSALSLRGLVGIQSRTKALTPISRRQYATCLGESPHFGEIRHTSPVVEAFDGSQLVHRRTWTPPMALIVSEPQDMGFDHVCRAVLCSVEEVCDEEILESTANLVFTDAAGFRYVAHLDLEYPVSTAQLGALVGQVEGSEVVALQEVMLAHLAGEDHPRLCSPGVLSTHGRAVYRRMAANANWLAATAEARRDHYEAQQRKNGNVIVIFDEPETTRLVAEAEENLPLAAAGGGKCLTPVLVLLGPVESLREAVTQAMRAKTALRQATMSDPPFAGPDGTASGQWIAEFQIREGCEFFLVHKKNGFLLGAGHVAAEGVLHLERAERQLVDDGSPSEFLLILVEEERRD
jgi:hypothetical protein